VAIRLDKEDMELFVSEADELFQTLEENLLLFERDGSTPEAIAAVFRAAHTLKGSAATAGFSEMALVTHRMEDIFQKARDGLFVFDRGSIDALLLALDWLRSARQAIVSSAPLPDPDPVILRLTSMKSVSKASRRVILAFAPDVDMLAVRMYQAVLTAEELGGVVGSTPSLQAIENENPSPPLTIDLTSSHDDSQIKARLSELPGVTDVRIVSPPTSRSAAAGPAAEVAAPVTHSVRVDVSLIDSLVNLVGELIIDRTRLSQIISELGSETAGSAPVVELNSTVGHLARITGEIQDGIMRARLMPLDILFRKYPRMVRDLAQKKGKEVQFVIGGGDTELDRSVIECLDDPLIHLLRNSVDHGIEVADERVSRGKPPCGTVQVTARHEDNHVVVEVKDDGGGIDPERVKKSAIKKGLISAEAADRLTKEQATDLVFVPGFSTAEQISETSGRGVGLDIVLANLKKINGSIEAITEVGKGTTFLLRLPLTLAILKALLTKVGSDTYAIPVSAVQEVQEIRKDSVQTIGGRQVIVVRDKVVPLLHLSHHLNKGHNPPSAVSSFAVMVQSAGVQVAIGVSDILSEQEVVVKSLGPLFRNVRGVYGATILGQGDLALILDVHAIVAAMNEKRIA
jgi:two-component system, chemotaxis family, sensor kinase CheA